ncbi:restriction endonuclease [Streptomyces tendae]|uniref:restriction endonuclease n=1 Tax=Streptomyces tendae TaxID=1932 RepID=UPI003EC043A9
MNSTHRTLHDPDGTVAAQLPVDRGAHMLLAKAVIGWTDPLALQPADYEQIALQLTGYAQAVARDVRGRIAALDEQNPGRVLTEQVLEETDRRLPAPYLGTMVCAQGRARLLRALYERLDRLPAPPSPAQAERVDEHRPPPDAG